MRLASIMKTGVRLVDWYYTTIVSSGTVNVQTVSYIAGVLGVQLAE